MKIYRSLMDKALKTKPRSIAIGIFDGVHLGHQKILKSALTEARKRKIGLCVVTFDPHPEKILNPRGRSPKILMSLDHRLSLLKSFGVDEVLVIPFNAEIANITHDDFLIKILIGRLGMRSLSVGQDFRFGKKAMGDIAYLKQRSKELSYGFFAAKPVLFRRHAISSTRIRQEIEAGHLVDASKMLGRAVSVSGTVVRGHGRGEALGFPTANLNPHHETLPPAGVYAAFGFVGRHKLKGVVHIGKRPTFGESDPSLEAHFLQFHRTIYGKTVELIFVKLLRTTRRFSSANALKMAIQRDISRAGVHLRGKP
jgi:riboflavin kinase/FMN adenylyltransferase